MKQRIVLLLLGFFLCTQSAYAVVPALEREVNFTVSNEPIAKVLAKIQEQTDVIFSYNSLLLSNISPLTLQLKHKTIREALTLMLPKSIEYKAKNNYIILKEQVVKPNEKKKEISGYVYEKNTNKKVANVTIYDKTTLQSATTNDYGFYSISAAKEEQCLTVNKEKYRDTCVALTTLEDSQLANITIDPVADTLQEDSLRWKLARAEFNTHINNLFVRSKAYFNMLNVKDSLSRDFQLSLLPFVGTNGLLSGNVYNKFSVNVFGGYARGTKGVEAGGFFNIDRENMKGAQFAGFFNVVGDTMKGVQAAGFFNVTGKGARGIQGAGFFNLNFGEVKGVQGAGFLNVNRELFKGLQMAGFMNVGLNNLYGGTLSGLVNFTWKSNRSIEAAGLVNVAQFGDNNIQLAGLANKTTKGTTAFQAAGLLNSAHFLKGAQIGVINYADSASGVPIGLLSIVKTGVHQIEISADEWMYGNVSLRSGVNAFHNIFSAGISPNQNVWQVGYGVGTSIKIKNKLRADVNVSVHHISKGNFYIGTSEWGKIYLGLEYRFSKGLSLAAGPTFNFYWSDKLLPDYNSTYSSITPYHSYNVDLANDFNLKGWYGARVALRVF
ncbi:MAG: hypothetical protein NT150_13755 [Bacteroidetes bacterium]|nr:hypothetical protein [Bacteroidota bacterium]